MDNRVWQLLAVLSAVLLVTASGPAAAYQYSQDLPSLDRLETGDLDDLLGQPSPPKSSGHFATPPPRRSSFVEQFVYAGAWPQGGLYSSLGQDNGRENDNRGKSDDRGKAGDKGRDGGEGKDEDMGKDGNQGKGTDQGQRNGHDEGTGNGQGPRECAGTVGTPSPPNATGKCARGRALTVESGDIDLGQNATALEHRQAAWTLIAEANVSAPGNSGRAIERKRQRALAQLNTTYAHVLDEDRVTSAAVFRTDHRAIAPLHKQLPNATRHLVASDRLLAGQAIADVETVRAALEERNVSYDETAVRENLTEARAAYQRGRRQPEQSRHAAIQHYREGWTHAQRAIDIMDEAVEPNVTIERDRTPSYNDLDGNPLAVDRPRNNSSTLRVTGTVFEIRGYELTATLAVNNTTHNLTLAAETAPLSTVSFNRTVELDRQWPAFRNGTATANASLQTYTVNVSVRDPGVDLADQGYDENEQRDVHQPQVGGGELYFDGDGLPGWYEQEETGTDPLDPDSDADGDIDGIEDPDESLVNYQEMLAGTDPLAPDTDGDNLTDVFELQWKYDPLAPDSDGDNVSDGREDPDEDALVNVDEQHHESSPRTNDTDRDGFADGREVHELGTDPTKVDTDEDQLDDSTELELPTDPLDPDTDDDGVVDGNETFTTSTGNESLGVDVAVTGEGVAAECLTIDRETGTGFNGSHIASVDASAVVRLRCSEAFESMRLTIEYNESAVATTESDLAAYRYDRDNQRFVKLPSTVHSHNDTVSARATRVGTFVVMASSAWEEQLPDEDDQPGPSIEKNSFEVDLSECSGFCESDGGGITVGVTNSGKGEMPGLMEKTDDGRELRSTRARREPLVEANGTSFDRSVNGSEVVYSATDPITFSSGDAEDTLGIQTSDVTTNTHRDPEMSAYNLSVIDTSLATDVYLEFTVIGTVKGNASWKVLANGEDGNRTLATFTCHGEDCEIKDEFDIDTSVGGIAGDQLKLQAVGYGNGGITLNDLEVGLVIDSDGDGLPDAEDLCASTGGPGENGCPDSTYDAAFVKFDEPVDTVQISASGLGYVETGGSSVELAIEDASGQSHTLYSLSSVTSDPESFSVNEQTISGVGDELRLLLEAKGTAALNLQSLQMKIDTDGDGFWDSTERQGIYTERFGRIKLDPHSADTDGDGLTDDEEVAGKRSYAPIYDLHSRPDRVHSDGDGLSDYEESTKRTISITTSPGQTQTVNEADTASEATGAYSPVEVTSDPLAFDTDGDGFSDWREMVNGTDPEAVDTDGDGIRDAEEVNVGEDPTEFDSTSPEVVVQSIYASGSALANTVTYEVIYRVVDPSGVAEVAFYKKGNRQADVTVDGSDSTGMITTSFEFTGYETLLVDGVLGPKVNVSTVDTHDNDGYVTRRGQNSFSRLAELVGTAELPGLDELLEDAPPEVQAVFETVDQANKVYPVLLMAILSGISYSAGIAIKDLVKLITEFHKVAAQILQMVVTFVTNAGLILKIPGMLIDSAVAAQEIQNPFPGTELPSLEEFDLDVRHTVFATGWYVGGLVGMIGAEYALSLGVGALAKGLAHLSSKVAALLRTTRAAQLLMRSSRLVKASKWLVTAVSSGAGALRYLDPGFLLAKLAKLTGGKAVRVLGQIDELSGPTLRAINDADLGAALVDYASIARSSITELARYVTPDGYVHVLRLRRADGMGSFVGDTPGETLVGRIGARAGLDRDQVDDILNRFSDVDKLDQFGDALSRVKSSRAKGFLRKFDPHEIAFLARSSQLRSAVELFDMGVTKQMMLEVPERGLNLNRINGGLMDYGVSPMKLTSDPDSGEIGEVLADSIIIRKRYADSDRYAVYPADADSTDAPGIDFDPSFRGEFDHVVVDRQTGKVVSIYETKIINDRQALDDLPASQAQTNLDTLLRREDTSISADYLDKRQFKDTDVATRGIGPKDANYDVDTKLPYSNQELKMMFEILTDPESSITKERIKEVIRRSATDPPLER